MPDTAKEKRRQYRAGAVLVIFSPEERELLRGVAKADDRSLAAWIRHVCLKAARQGGNHEPHD